MSQYYNSQRKKNLYDPEGREPFKVSRSKIDLFIECPRCFYLDRRLGIARPPGFPFSLNSAVDLLLKKEFDHYRSNGEIPPLIKKNKIDARPVAHKNLNDWRTNFTGVQFLHQPTNLLITGAIDDLWQNSAGEYIVVDYKATAKAEEITALDQDWQIGYKRQMEIYQWLLRQNGLPVSDTGYFVYCNGDASQAMFDAELKFRLSLIAYSGSDAWVAPVLLDLHACLAGDSVPASGAECDYCAYIAAVEGAGE